MKKSYLFAHFLLLAAGLCCCTSEENIHLSPGDENSLLSITASHPGNLSPATKTTLSPSGNNPQKGLAVTWAKNDIIKLVRSVGNQHATTDLILVGKAGQQNATFNGQALPSTEETAIYKAFYPATKGGETPEDWKRHASYNGQVQRGYGDTRHLSDFDYLQTHDMETLSEDFQFYHTGIVFCFDLNMPEGTPAIPYSLTLATTDAQDKFTSDGGLFCDCNATPASAITLGFAECQEAVTQFQAYMTLACNIKQEQKLTLILTLEDGSRYAHKLKAKQDIISPAPGENTSGISYFIPVSTWEKIKAETYTKTTASVAPVKGSGTQESPYLISSAKEFRYLVGNVSKSNGKYYRLTTDIIIAENAEWQSIGNSTNKFSGHFDGNGHIIQSNLIQNSIFGYTGNNASIRNLTVIANITNTSNTYIGGIVGNADNTIIVNCHYKGKLIDKTTERLNIGGIVGQASNACTIHHCTSHGEIQGESSNTTGNVRIGGIVGISMASKEVKNCNNYSTIKSSNSYTGGIIGYINNISSFSNIVGCTNYGKIYNCGTITNITTSSGGIAGNTTNTSFIDVRNAGDIIGSETKGRNYIGGIIGSQGKETSLFRAVNSGNIIGYSNGKTDSRTGGLVGNASENSGTLHQCYNQGNVSVTGTIGALTYIGTYIGYSTSPKIHDCCRTAPEVVIQESGHAPLPLQKCTEKHIPMQ